MRGEAELRETDNKIAKLAEAVSKHGFKYTRLAEETGLPISTCRYILLKVFPSLGLLVQANVDFGRLGLKRVLAILSFTERGEGFATFLLDHLARTGYLTYFTRLLPSRRYLTIFGIPPSELTRFNSYLNLLRKDGVLENYRVTPLWNLIRLKFKGRYYDAGARAWKIPWDELKPGNSELPPREYAEKPASIDFIDLKILEELQQNALTKMNTMARNLGLSRVTISAHLHQHVLGYRLLTGFSVFWFPINDVRESLILLTTQIQAKSSEEMEKIYSVIDSIPYSLATALSEDLKELFTFYVVPALDLQNMILYMSKHIPQPLSIHFNDPDNIRNYTLPIEMFDATYNKWKQYPIKLLEERARNDNQKIMERV